MSVYAHLGKYRTLFVFLHHLGLKLWLSILNSTMSSMQDLDSQVAEIERQMACLTQKMRKLKTARNALAPLGRLPDEILLHIAQRSIPHDIPVGSPRQALYLTWICRRLRALFVGYPGLWNQIEIDGSASRLRLGFRTFLDRAASFPLQVRHTGPISEDTLQALMILLPQSAVCHLYEMATPEDSRTYALEAHFHNNNAEYPMIHTMKIFDAFNLLSLRQAMFPNMVALDIEDVYHDPVGVSLPDLPTLRIFRLAYTLYPLHVLHSFFSHSPFLESVDLIHVLEAKESDEGSDDESDNESDNVSFMRSPESGPVQLPHLSHLGIIEAPEGVVLLLHILPNPTFSFVLDSQNFGSPQAEWDSSASRLIHLRLKELWCKNPGAMGSLPDGIIEFDARRKLNEKLLIRFSREGLSYTEDHYRPLTNRRTLLAQVKTLKLHSLGDPNADTDPLHTYIALDCLPNVERVLFNGLRNASESSIDDVLSLEQWISARSDEGRPFQSILFQNCDEKSRPLLTRLADKRVASSIAWE
jgi:hypothetical protein